jgi:hypothetical protein
LTATIEYVRESTTFSDVAVSVRMAVPAGEVSFTAEMKVGDVNAGGLFTSVTSSVRGAEAIAPLAVAAETVTRYVL